MPRTRNTSSPLFVLVAAVVLIGALYFAKAILLPFALAVLLSFLLTPLANRLERWGLPRVPSVLVVAGLSFAVMAVLIWIVIVQAIDLGSKVDAYKGEIVAKIRAISEGSVAIGKFADTLEELGKEIRGIKVKQPLGDQAGGGPPVQADSKPAAADREQEAVPITLAPASRVAQLRDWLGPLVAPLGSAGLVVVLVVFILLKREDQRNRLIELFGTTNLHVTTEGFTDAAGRVMRYLRMQFLINAGYGFCVACALAALGVPNAIMWGVLGFMLRFLPYIGPILAAAMPIAVSAAVSDGWTQPLLVLGWFIVLELVLNNLIEPWVYGSSIGVSAVGIIVAAIFWTWLWGPIGLVLAMPLTVCLVVLANYVPQMRFITVLLGDRQALSLAERTYQRLLAMDDNEVRKLAQQHLKAESLAAYYDDVLIPALALAERDRHAGLLNDEQESFIAEAAEDLVEELAAAGEKSDASAEAIENIRHDPDRPNARVLCIPLRDHADQTTTAMLAQLLVAEGFHVDVASVDSLTNELVDEVARLGSQIVVISILPPCSPRNSRLLYRRLRGQYPNLPVIVGYWSAVPGEHLAQRFELSEPDKLVTSLSEGVEAVRSAANGLRSDADAQRPAQPAAPPATAMAGS
ncbi:MAG: AI-2E family transporter [Pirellulales bacterium]